MGGRMGVGGMHISGSAVELCRDEGMKKKKNEKTHTRSLSRCLRWMSVPSVCTVYFIFCWCGRPVW